MNVKSSGTSVLPSMSYSISMEGRGKRLLKLLLDDCPSSSYSASSSASSLLLNVSRTLNSAEWMFELDIDECLWSMVFGVEGSGQNVAIKVLKMVSAT